MDDKELSNQAMIAFPGSRRKINKYFSLLGHLSYYGELMEKPDSPWVCTAYNTARDNFEKFCRKHPEIAEWIDRRRELSRKENNLKRPA